MSAPLGTHDSQYPAGAPSSAASLTTAELLDYVTLRAAEAADRRIAEREERRRRGLAIILSVASLVGVSVVVGVVDYKLDDMVRDQLKLADEERDRELASFKADLDDKLNNFREQIGLLVNAGVEKAGQKADTAIATAQTEAQHQGEQYRALVPQLQAQIEGETRVAISDKVDGLQQGLDREVAYFQLSNLARELDVADGFSDDERTTVLRLLRRVHKEGLEGREDFPVLLERILDSFHAANQTAAVDEIASMFESLSLQSPGIIQTLINHYGQRAMGAPPTLTGVDGSLNQLRKYAAHAGSAGQPEIGVLWSLFLSVHLGDDAAEHEPNRQAVLALGKLDEVDRVFFGLKLVEYSVPEMWVMRPSPMSEQLAHEAERVRRAYLTELRTLFATIPEGMVERRVFAKLAEMEADSEAQERAREILTELREPSAEMHAQVDS